MTAKASSLMSWARSTPEISAPMFWVKGVMVTSVAEFMVVLHGRRCASGDQLMHINRSFVKTSAF